MDDMNKVVPIRSPEHAFPDGGGLRIGRIVAADEEGRFLVNYPGSQGPLPALLTYGAREKLRQDSSVGRKVLLGFEHDGHSSPIIIDIVWSPGDETAVAPSCVVTANGTEEILVDGKRIFVDAEEEIVLRCGESSIVLTRAGKIEIRGTYLVSRSTGTNSIKGGSVRIN